MSSIAARIGRIATDHPDVLAVRTATRDVTYGDLLPLAAGSAERLSQGGATGPVIGLVRDAIDVAVVTLAAGAAGRPIVIVAADLPPSAVAAIASVSGAEDTVVPPGAAALPGLRTWVGYPSSASWHPAVRPADATVALVSTSGSTGAPRFIGLLEERFGRGSTEGSVLRDLSSGDRVATSYSTASAPFGAIVRCLLAGATCTVLDVRRVPRSRLLKVLDEHAVERIRMVPSVLRQFVASVGTAARLEHARVVGAVGEPLDWHDVTALRPLLTPSCIITNAYGSTEAGLLTERTIAPDEPPGSGRVDIGHPLPGRHLWIDSGDGTSASAGVIGVIVVEGRLGASGIAATEVGDGIRRFRTGDLGSIGSDGAFSHHGRIDRVTKVAGHRVELGAIESAIRNVDGVLDVAVVEHLSTEGSPDGRARMRLIAHVWAEDGLRLEVLREELHGHLLQYALPAAVQLHREPLPLLPSGKLDLRALTGRA